MGWEGFILALQAATWVKRNVQLVAGRGLGVPRCSGPRILKRTPSFYGINEEVWGTEASRREGSFTLALPHSSLQVSIWDLERESVCVYVWVWRAFEKFSGFSSAVWNVWGETRWGKAERSCYLRFKETPKEYWALCSNAGWMRLVCQPVLGGQPEKLEDRDVYHSWKGYGQRSQLCLKPHYSKYGPPKGGISSPVPEPASTFQKDLPVYLKNTATDYSNSPSVLCIKSIFSDCDSYQSQVEGICSISG